jgi:DHA2 family multidrug resistance protein
VSDDAASAAAPVHPEWHAPYNPWLIAMVATLATFMEVLDTTIVTVALPHISGNLGSDIQESTWVLTSYLVSNAIILPISAWLSSVFGRRNYYLGCVALFTVSSFLCGIAPSMRTLVFFRLLQGLGGGGLQPSTQAILVDTFPPRRRGMGMALFGMAVVVAPILGPTLGGWITDNFNWRWIFFINIPVGIASLVLGPKLITDPPYLIRRHGPKKWRADYIGLALLAVGLGTLQLFLDLGERRDWFASRLIMGLAITSAITLVAVTIWEFNVKDPIVNVHLMRERNLGASVMLMFLFGGVLYASTVLLPLFMQTLLGYTSLLSGLAISPGGLVVFSLMPLIGFMVSRFDPRKMIMLGMAILSISLFYMGHFSSQVNFGTIVTARMIQGLSFAFIFVPVNTVAYAYVAREQRNAASSLMSLARNIGASIGIAFINNRLAQLSQVHQAYLAGNVSMLDPEATARLHAITARLTAATGDPVASARQALQLMLYNVAREARALAFVDSFYLLAVVVLCIIPLVWFMRRPKHHAHEAAEAMME